MSTKTKSRVGYVRPAAAIEFGALIALLKDPAVPVQKKTESVKRIRLSLSRNTRPPIKELLAIDGCLEALVECLQDSRDGTMQHESAWVITNIASGTPEDTKAVAHSGAVKALSKLILDVKEDPESCNDEIVEQAVQAIGNIVGDGTELRNIVFEGEPELLSKLTEMSSYPHLTSTARNTITWVVGNFLSGKPSLPRDGVVVTLPLLVRNIMTPANDDILIDSLWALSWYADGDPPNERVNDILNSNPEVLSKLCEHLSSRQKGVLLPALRTFGNIASATTGYINQILESGVLPLIHELLLPGCSRGDEEISKDCCWFLSNITAETPDCIQQVIDGDFLELLVRQVRTGNAQCRREAIWALANLVAGGTNKQIAALLPFVKDLMEVFGRVRHETIEFVDVIHVIAETQNVKFLEILDREDLLRLQSTVILRVESDDDDRWREHCVKVGQMMEQYELFGF